MVLHLGVIGSNHRNIYIKKKILKNLLLQSHLAQMVVLYQVCSDGGPGIQHGLTLWGLRFKP